MKIPESKWCYEWKYWAELRNMAGRVLVSALKTMKKLIDLSSWSLLSYVPLTECVYGCCVLSFGFICQSWLYDVFVEKYLSIKLLTGRRLWKSERWSNFLLCSHRVVSSLLSLWARKTTYKVIQAQDDCDLKTEGYKHMKWVGACLSRRTISLLRWSSTDVVCEHTQNNVLLCQGTSTHI